MHNSYSKLSATVTIEVKLHTARTEETASGNRSAQGGHLKYANALPLPDFNFLAGTVVSGSKQEPFVVLEEIPNMPMFLHYKY